LKDSWEIRTFKDWNVKEEQLEDFVAKHIGLIVGDDETMMIVGRQVRDKQKKTNDLLAIDDTGNLVLIEIKRDLEDVKKRSEPLEFQAIRYCASLATIETPEDLVEKVFAAYIDKYREPQGNLTASEQAQRNLDDFLRRNNITPTAFNKKQRIILVGADYDETTKSACCWLNENGVDIKLIKLEPWENDGERILNIETVLPLLSPQDHYVDLLEKGRKSTHPVKHTDRDPKLYPRMDKLFEWGAIQKGDEIYISGSPSSAAKIIDDKHVDYQGRKMTYNEWGCEITGWQTIAIYRHAVLKRTNELLNEIRAKEMDKRGIKAPWMKKYGF